MTKIICTTTYENVNAEWFSWYLDRLRSQPELCVAADGLEKNGYGVFVSKDPTGSVVGTTEYEAKP